MTIAQTATAPAPAPAAAPPRPRVFVIDDDEVMLLSCRRILEKEGYEVETFETGAAGLGRLAAVKPQLLLVDLKMPELDGIQVIGRVRKLDPDLVIAVITGYATIATAVDAMKAGAYDFLPKPFTPDELRLVVTRGCERWQLADAARQLKEEKSAAERRVITFVSHQLKSPLVAAKQYLDVLLHTEGAALPETGAAWIRRAQARLEEMLALIDDWLTLAHVDRGVLGRPGATADLRDVIAQLLDAVSPQAERASIRVSANLPPDLPRVRGDAVSLAMVLSNVVINGIKYNRPGGEVAISTAADEQMVRVAVRDNGIGIPEESLSRIFDEFYRVIGPAARETTGTGLGLAICRRVLGELGGSIDVVSTLGTGSTFTIAVPRAGDPRKSSAP